MDDEAVLELLREVQAGRTSPDDAVIRLRRLPIADLGFARVDTHRALRQGMAEVVLGAGKSAEQIAAIVRELLAAESSPVLVTRIDGATAAAVLAANPAGRYLGPARLAVWRAAVVTPDAMRIAVVTAGTSDRAVADEAGAVATASGAAVTRIDDVGVAGIHRLLGAAGDIDAADVVIVVAGMEGALASVVGGLVEVPVVAVPTSTGYGAAFEGLAALLGMLSCCAAGVTVVNIDNGFGAAMAAFRIARVARRMSR